MALMCFQYEPALQQRVLPRGEMCADMECVLRSRPCSSFAPRNTGTYRDCTGNMVPL